MACQFLKLYCTRASRLCRLGFPFFGHFPSFPWFACCRCSHLFIGYAESYSYPVGECVPPLDIITKPPPCPKTLCASCWVYLLSKILKSTPAVLFVSSQNSYKEGLYESSLHLACFTEGTWANLDLYGWHGRIPEKIPSLLFSWRMKTRISVVLPLGDRYLGLGHCSIIDVKLYSPDSL